MKDHIHVDIFFNKTRRLCDLVLIRLLDLADQMFQFCRHRIRILVGDKDRHLAAPQKMDDLRVRHKPACQNNSGNTQAFFVADQMRADRQKNIVDPIPAGEDQRSVL